MYPSLQFDPRLWSVGRTHRDMESVGTIFSSALAGNLLVLVATSAVAQLTLYAGSIALNSSVRLSPKKRAYVLCLYTAAFSTAGALAYAPRLLREGLDLSYYMHDDPLSRFSAVHFATYLVLDLMVGALHYPQYLGIFTGWIHHVVYVAILAFAVQQRVTLLFMAALPLEIPTLVLSAGSVFPALRSDYVFGASFFAFRILYHCYTLAELLTRDAPSWMWQVRCCCSRG